MYFDVVGVVEVVAEIVLGEVEGDAELGLVRGEVGCADQSDGELGPGPGLAIAIGMVGGDAQEDLLAAEGDNLLGNGSE